MTTPLPPAPGAATDRPPLTRADLGLPPLSRSAATARAASPPPAGGSGWRRQLLTLAGALLLWTGLRMTLVEAYRIPSPSMEPALLPGDVLLVAKAPFGVKVGPIQIPGWRQPRHGDVVVFRSPIEPIMVVKRVAGLAGDTLEMTQGRLLRNGQPVEEPYRRVGDTQMVRPSPSLDELARLRRWQQPYLLPSASPERRTEADADNWGPFVVPPGQAFVLGDNRDESLDSRFWGFLPMENIRGTPWRIYWSYDPEQSIFSLRPDRLGRLVR